MQDRSAQTALRAALADWRRHLAAIAVITGAFVITHHFMASPSARYGAYLLSFAVWMAWFVLTAVEWIRHADF